MGYTVCYTFHMKTAISIDKELFEDYITEKLDSYYRNRESGIDDGLKAAAHRLFAEEDW